MYWKKKNKEARQRLDAALESVDYSAIGQIVKQLSLKPKSRKKTDAIAEIEPFFRHPPKLLKLYEQLDDLQKKAVAEALYDKNNEYEDGRFRAKYGAVPTFWKKISQYEREATVLCLFICDDDFGKFISKELAEKLKLFVPKPKSAQIKSSEILPETVSIEFPSWQKKESKNVALTILETETLAPKELTAVMRLLDTKKITVSDKNSFPSSSSAAEIVSVLPNGDFYELKEEKEFYPQIGAIKGFAWAMIFQAARLTQVSAKKLSLTAESRKILTKAPHEVSRFLWEKWQKNTLLDEFRRVDQIKGQSGKNAANMTGIKPRRESIVNALKSCPADEWIAIGDFFRHLRVGGFDFGIVRDEWELYISSQDYGSLGYEYGSKHDQWLILQGRYVLAVLFEYAATLGLIDVAYIPPFDARQDYRELWGTDDLDFLSRYDGLKYIRINDLGTYCLGLKNNYTPPKVDVKSSLTVLPNLKIKVEGASLPYEEDAFLANFAEKESESVWLLSRELLIKALENGQNIEALREFLQAREEQPLPETVEGFLRDAKNRAAALREKGLMRLFECRTAEIAAQIAENPQTKKFCLRVGEKSIAVSADSEAKFREIIRQIGYGIGV